MAHFRDLLTDLLQVRPQTRRTDVSSFNGEQMCLRNFFGKDPIGISRLEAEQMHERLLDKESKHYETYNGYALRMKQVLKEAGELYPKDKGYEVAKVITDERREAWKSWNDMKPPEMPKSGWVRHFEGNFVQFCKEYDLAIHPLTGPRVSQEAQLSDEERRSVLDAARAMRKLFNEKPNAAIEVFLQSLQESDSSDDSLAEPSDPRGIEPSDLTNSATHIDQNIARIIDGVDFLEQCSSEISAPAGSDRNDSSGGRHDCSVCGKTFSWTRAYSLHMKTHDVDNTGMRTGDYPESESDNNYQHDISDR